MYNNILILGKEQIKIKLTSLKLYSEKEGIYKDLADNTLWKLQKYESEMLGLELSAMEKQPPASIVELVEIMLYDECIENAITVALIIHDRDFDHDKYNRLFIIDQLEKHFDNNVKDSQKIRLCILEMHLYDATNRDYIINKTYDDIQKSAQFYKEISLRSKKLLSMIDNNVNNSSDITTKIT